MSDKDKQYYFKIICLMAKSLKQLNHEEACDLMEAILCGEADNPLSKLEIDAIMSITNKTRK